MHIESALISTAVAVGFTAIQTGATAVAAKKAISSSTSIHFGKAAAAGALVFALQMLNFAIPGTGSSGHVVGAILLCLLLGKWGAFLTMGGVLLVQSLFFGDGGLLAFSCNWFNMAFIPCLIVYPLAIRLFKGDRNRIALIAPVFSLLLGAFAATTEICLSGYAAISFWSLLSKMLFIHLFIGIGEGLIIWSVLILTEMGKAIKFEWKAVTLAIVVGCAFSLLASTSPDGLEWSLGYVMNGSSSIVDTGIFHHSLDKLQQATTILPDYSFSGVSEVVGKSLSGLVGIVFVMTFIFLFQPFLSQKSVKV